MEFGVFKGDTINAAADYRKLYCETSPPPIYGFDTFQGLPEQWGTHMEQVSPALDSTTPLLHASTLTHNLPALAALAA